MWVLVDHRGGLEWWTIVVDWGDGPCWLMDNIVRVCWWHGSEPEMLHEVNVRSICLYICMYVCACVDVHMRTCVPWFTSQVNT